MLQFCALAYDIDITKTGDNSDDQAQIKKDHVVEQIRQPIAEPAADQDCKNQGKTDGAGLEAAGE